VNRRRATSVKKHEGAIVLEDGEIIRRCLCGQMGMMDVLIDRYKTDLYTLCVKLAGDRHDADDLFQDTWVKAMRNLASYNSEHRFRTWLFAICTNRYRDLYRWRKRWWRRLRRLGEGAGRGGGLGDHLPEEELATAEADQPTPEEWTISRETGSAVREALDALDESFRLPILLHYFHDLSVSEIGEILGIAQGTVKTRLLRGREKLRAALEAGGHGR
jgi:RNA polymerase sigma-70 factor (ECF subfamily)